MGMKVVRGITAQVLSPVAPLSGAPGSREAEGRAGELPARSRCAPRYTSLPPARGLGSASQLGIPASTASPGPSLHSRSHGARLLPSGRLLTP
jgi:hypothetical protein